MPGLRSYAKHKPTKSRFLVVQRQFKELGSKRLAPGLRALIAPGNRIYLSSGTNDPKEFDLINDMLTRLALAAEKNDDALTLLAKLATRQIRFLDALKTFTDKGLDGIKKYGSEDGPIDEASFSAWLNTHPVADSTRTIYKANYRTLMKFAAADDTMKDLPVILQRYKNYCVREKKNYRSWNYCLAVVQAWSRAILGKRSEVYEALSELERFSIKKRHRHNRYYSPADIHAFIAKLPFDIGRMCWTMCLTGMGPKEMMVDGFAVEGKGIHIFGQRTDHRDRVVPLIEDPAPVMCTRYATFWQHIRRVDANVNPYDFRRCYPRWLLDAGVPYNRVQQYQGHAPQTQTDEYAWSQTQQFLNEDAERMRKWLKSQLRPRKKPRQDHTSQEPTAAWML